MSQNILFENVDEQCWQGYEDGRGMRMAGKMISVAATDGFAVDAYYVSPQVDAAKVGIICVMEAFGLNDHIRRVADDYAAQGYSVVAPSLYDRQQRNITVGYDNIPLAVEKMLANGFDNPIYDIEGCVTYLRAQGVERIGIVGYCYGGGVSWLAAARVVGINAASCYYGTAIMNFADVAPQCATIAHWGKADPTTPADKIAVVSAANPQVTMYWYDAGHGFNSDDRDFAFDSNAARVARQRTLDFFREQLQS